MSVPHETNERATPYMHRNKIFDFSTMATITKQTWYLLALFFLLFVPFFFSVEDKHFESRAFYMHRWFLLSVCLFRQCATERQLSAFCGRWGPYACLSMFVFNRKQITLIYVLRCVFAMALSHDHLFFHLCLYSIYHWIDFDFEAWDMNSYAALFLSARATEKKK